MDPTRRAFAWLSQWQRGNLRNTARAWLGYYLGRGRGPSAPELARLSGGLYKTVTTHFSLLEDAGVIDLDPTFVEGVQRAYHLARLVPGVDAVRLLGLLGPFEYAHHCPDKWRCERCGLGSQRRQGPLCGLCVDLERLPWLADRLDYLADRAARGLPLFDPAPPWMLRTDRHPGDLLASRPGCTGPRVEDDEGDDEPGDTEGED